MFSLMTQPVPPAQRGKSAALYLKNPRLQLRADFQGLESSRPDFPRIGKSRGNFSKPWKKQRSEVRDQRSVFRGLEKQKTEVRDQRSVFRGLEKQKTSTQRRREKAKDAKHPRRLCA
jgi:hypothetical protein